MVELADTTDLSSVDDNIVRVQVPLPVLLTCRWEALDLVCWDTNDRQCGCLKTLAGMILMKEYIHSAEVKPSCASVVQDSTLLYNKGRKGAKTSET